MPRILIIDDDAEVCGTMQSLADRMQIPCDTAFTLQQGIAQASSGTYDIIFLDVRLPDGNGLTALPDLKRALGQPEIIILTGQGDPDGAELAIQGGAWDYLVKPSSIKQTMLSIRRALSFHEEKLARKRPVALHLENVIGVSQRMQQCFDMVAQAAQSDAGVLVTGETGTGKELFARAIHANSARARGRFVVVDCAALTETLVESTLFGHRKGAFTGADRDREGLVKLADGGTLFLDEVGELPPAMQKAFLRVLQERKFRPVGSGTEVHSDFRLIAATHRNLDEMVATGTFRNDLLFRIKTIYIALPPLRARPEDIKQLAAFRVDKLCEKYGLPGKAFDADTMDVLTRYTWEGNVRELFNVLERAFVAAGQDKVIYAMHLPQDVRIKVAKAHLAQGRKPEPAPVADTVEAAEETAPPASCLDDGPLPSLKEFKGCMERQYLEAVIRRCQGNIQDILDTTGLSRSHLYALLKKYSVPF
ncbi:MAG: sigma-54-dependent transcriptional regulator [Desulfovibrionaceae bacterium]